MRPRLVVFAKAPLIGLAKTRLARRLGRAQAARVYRAMTARILRQTADPRWDTILAVTPDGWTRRTLPVWPAGVPRTPQGGGDLGARQARAFTRGMTVVIGTDAPDVRARDIAQAFNALRRNRAVIGPAEDGGYWLLGLKRPAESGLFSGVPWSSPQTMAELRSRLPHPVKLLRQLADLDK